MKKICLFIFFLILLNLSAFCQKDSLKSPGDGRKPYEKGKDNVDWRDKIYFGGTFGAGFGSYTFVDISPLIGYKITKKFSVGVGVIYNYFSSNGAYKYSTSFYGGRCFARYFIWENIFAQIGWDHINRNDPYSYKVSDRIWVDNYLVGGGVRYPISDHIYCTAVGLWNLNYDPTLSPYYNPIIQIGFVGRF